MVASRFRVFAMNRRASPNHLQEAADATGVVFWFVLVGYLVAPLLPVLAVAALVVGLCLSAQSRAPGGPAAGGADTPGLSAPPAPPAPVPVKPKNPLAGFPGSGVPGDGD